ncbi:MAG: glycine cleavage system aminomethyltransferase GcvT [Bacteroidales bacterium]|jgi:aminomethyltransferase|nr:glycine cleavage system aminomethyltransferase GcvT [Bacteroidales bacterium]
MKKTPFTDIHISLGARMHEFVGYNMPIEYSGIFDEHQTVCKSVGIFDVSHMGEFWVKGTHALPFLQKITSNDVSSLPQGKAQYSCFLNEKGGIVDDLLVYHYEQEKYFLVVNAANIEKDWEFCTKHNTEGAILENASDNIAQLAVQGPMAQTILQQLTTCDLTAVPYYGFVTGEIGGEKDVIISRTGYTGAGGFELYFYPSSAIAIWNAVFAAGKPFGIKPAGLGSRDTLRLEMGYCLYGNELNETITPLEAGLGWITKFVEGKNFLGREALEHQRNEGVKRKLIALELIEKGIPRNGYQVVGKSAAIQESIGHVTSGALSPLTKKGIALAYIQTNRLDTELSIIIRDKMLKAAIAKLPFRPKS